MVRIRLNRLNSLGEPLRLPGNGKRKGFGFLRFAQLAVEKWRNHWLRVLTEQNGEPNAYDPTADPQTAAAQGAALEVAAPSRMPAEARRLHPRVHHDAEETELRYA